MAPQITIVPVVRFGTPDVCRTVDQPRTMQTYQISQHPANCKRYVGVLIPAVPRYDRWNDEAKCRGQKNVVPNI
jgi:hypothetical protein